MTAVRDQMPAMVFGALALGIPGHPGVVPWNGIAADHDPVGSDATIKR